MITTHDLEICKLARENVSKADDVKEQRRGKKSVGGYQNIVNYSFCETYQGDEICFDYQLKKGKSDTTNGEYLLKQIGILKD